MPPMQPSFDMPIGQLNDRSEKPLYRQLYDHLREQIVSGKVTKNTQLPSEQELTQQLGISRITARRALNELAASGLVKRQRGLGTIVTFNAAAPSVKASFDNLIAGLNRMGVETKAQLLRQALIEPEETLAEIMEIEPGTQVHQIIRLRTLDGEPFSYLMTHIPEVIAESFELEDLESESLIRLLERAGHPPRAAQQTITAAAADTDIAQHLGIAPGSPIMRVHRIMRDHDNRVVQEITAHYRADRFQYQMNMIRHDDTNWMTEYTR